MAEQVKRPAVKAVDMSSTPMTHMVGGENPPLRLNRFSEHQQDETPLSQPPLSRLMMSTARKGTQADRSPL